MKVKIKVIAGICQGNLHQIGDEYIIDETTAKGICISAWDSISPSLFGLRYGADFPWEDKGKAIIHCPDINGITLELERIS